MKTHRIYAGYIEQDMKDAWDRQMKQDGFSKLWSWICWVIFTHIKNAEKEQYAHTKD